MADTSETGQPEGPAEPPSIALVFAAGRCPDCREPGEPGPCAHCGSEVPAAPDIGREAAARLAALGPVGARISELRREFDDLPTGRIPVTPDQFVAVISEADLFEVLRGLLALPGELDGLDLGDPKVVGKEVRRRVETHLDRVDALFSLCKEIAEFQTEGPGARYRELAIESGKYGADIADSLVRALTAPSFAEAREAAMAFEQLIAGFPLGQALSDALVEIEGLKGQDLDGRVALAIERSGTFADESGNVDLARVFAAFGDEDTPAEALETQAASYFARLTNCSVGGGDGGAAILIAPLVLVAAADRPLRAHRTLRMFLDALEAAWDRDQAAVEILVKRATAQGPIIFAALERVERAIQDIAADAGDDRALDRIMHAYRNLAEAAFRTLGWLAIGADLIARGKPLPDESQPPMLGEMQQRLEASGSVSQILADSVDANLRNADAHAQYRWDRDREVVKDMRTGQEWSVDDLDGAVKDLSSCLAGADAAYGCFVVSKGIDHGVPDWLADGEAPEALKFLATFCFGSYGHDVVSVQDGGGTIVIEPETLDPARLLPAVAAMTTVAPSVGVFRVLTPEGDVIVDVEAATMQRTIGASPALKGIEVLVATFENCLRLGMNPEKMAHDFAVLIVKVVAFSGLETLQDGELSRATFREVGDRLVNAG